VVLIFLLKKADNTVAFGGSRLNFSGQNQKTNHHRSIFFWWFVCCYACNR